MPIITIVAKTGLLIETRVIHMARFLGRRRFSPRLASGRTSALAPMPAPERAPGL